jgi:PEP-CTERM motif
MRAFFGRLSCAIAAVALLTVGVTTAGATPVQIGSFQSAGGNYSYVAGHLTGSTTGTWQFDPVFAATFGVSAAPYVGATLTIDATASSGVSCLGTFCQQMMDGYIEVSFGGSVLVRADFTDAFLQGFLGSVIVNLVGSDDGQALSPTLITYSSDVFNEADLIEPNTPADQAGLTFELNPITPVLSVAGSNFADFTGRDTANFSAATNLELVPEPAMLTLFGLGLSGAGVLARRRRQANNK